jgi:hypothetical protein
MSTALKVEVHTRRVGGSRDEGIGSVVLTLPESAVTVERLIREMVAAQIRQLRAERGLAADEIRRVLGRQYLLHDGTQSTGESVAATRGSMPDGEIDGEVEAASALEGFGARVYALLVNGRHVENLDDVIVLGAANRVTLLRLMAFSGG